MTGEGRRTLMLGGLVVGVLAVGFASLPEAPPRAVPVAVKVEIPEGRVRVEILNAGGVSGMAGDATMKLRDVGFDVVDFGNALPFDPERTSEVIDRVGRPDMAQAVADVLGIGNVRSEPDTNLYVDVSVMLGSDWITAVGVGADEGGAERAWWDPRGWLNR